MAPKWKMVVLGPEFVVPASNAQQRLERYQQYFRQRLMPLNCVYENGIIGARVYIFSNSQTALLAFKSYKVGSKLVSDCLSLLESLASRNKVIIAWIPGHEGFEGNKRSDCLAKRGACRPVIGPEPYFGVPPNSTHFKITQWEIDKHAEYWANLQGLREAKKFINPTNIRSKTYWILTNSI